MTHITRGNVTVYYSVYAGGWVLPGRVVIYDKELAIHAAKILAAIVR